YPDPYLFAQVLAQLGGPKLSVAEAASLQQQLASGDMVGDALSEVNDVSQTRDRSFWDRVGGSAGGAWDVTYASLSWLGTVLPGGSSDNSGAWDNIGNEVARANLQDGFVGRENHALNNLASEFGLNNLWLDENGSRTRLSEVNWQDSKSFDRLENGLIVNSETGGTPMTLQQMAATGGA